MTLDVALPINGTLEINDNELRHEFAGGISSLRNSWRHISPSSFDTVSLPEVGVSMRENTIIISFKTTSEIRSAQRLNKTIAEIVRLLWLPTDWNSDKSMRINPKAVEKIISLLLAIFLDSDSIPPIVVPTTRGGVQVEWHQNGVDLEIEAFNSNKLEYFFSGPTGDKEGTIEDDTTVLKHFMSYLKATSCTRRE